MHGGTGLRGPRPGREFPPPSQLIDLKSRNPDGRGRSQVKDTTMSDQNEREPLDVSRRAFLEGTSAALVIAATAPAVAAQTPAAQPAPVATTTISVTVNGTVHRVEVEDRWTLADLLRDQLRLTGTKLGCERGECGACTVHPRRQAGLRLQPARGVGRRPAGDDGRRAGAQRPAASAAAGVHRTRRAAVRLLHLRPADERQGAARPQPASDAAGRARRRWPATSAAARTTTATSKRSSRSAPGAPRRSIRGRREVRHEPAERLPRHRAWRRSRRSAIRRRASMPSNA